MHSVFLFCEVNTVFWRQPQLQHIAYSTQKCKRTQPARHTRARARARPYKFVKRFVNERGCVLDLRFLLISMLIIIGLKTFCEIYLSLKYCYIVRV